MSSRFLPSSDQDDTSSDSDDELVGVLERCTRELRMLCGSLDDQQQEEANSSEDIKVGTDTLTSLGEMADECATLLACLEAADNRTEELSPDSNVVDSILDEQDESPTQHEEDSTEPPRCLKLVQELDTFADELQELISCLGDSDEVESSNEMRPRSPPSKKKVQVSSQMNNYSKGAGINDEVPATKTTPSSPPPVPFHSEFTRQQDEVNQLKGFSMEKNAVRDTTSRGATNEKLLFWQNAALSHRTKAAVALHVRRVKFRRCGSRPRLSSKAKFSARGSGAKTDCAAKANAMRSRFRATSFQRHISRQKHARLRVQQAQTTLSQLEASRFRGVSPKAKLNGSSTTRAQKKSSSASNSKSYLGNFKPAWVSPSSEVEPRFLCAVYLYGLRRLGTTYITFNSMEQLEQRVRARFSIKAVASFYREVIDVDPKASERDRRKKRLQRVTTLDKVYDGDTLCVTQTAYDDMSILCEWIKRRQRIVHSFEHVRSSSKPVADEHSTPPKQKSRSNGMVKPQVWDSNGRSVGVKTQLSILSDDLWESNAH